MSEIISATEFIELPPLANAYLTGLATGASEEFSPAVLRELSEACARIGSGSTAPFEVRELTLHALAGLVAEMNSQFFRFELAGLGEPPQPVVLRLDAGIHEFPQLAVGQSHSTRKLTFLVPIDAGPAVVEVRLAHFDKSVDMTVGTVVAFPSFAVPTVVIDEDPATILVVHALGPAFR